MFKHFFIVKKSKNIKNMKGTLKKLEDQWCVVHSPFIEDGEQWHEATPIHPVSSEFDSENFKEDSEIEFELITKETHPDLFINLEIKEAALLTKKKRKVVRTNSKKQTQTEKIVESETSEKKMNKIREIMNKEVSLPKLPKLPKVPKPTIDIGSFKETTTSLDNVFYGSMLMTFFWVIGLLFYAYSFYFLLVPLGYVIITYIGKYTKTYLKKVFRDEGVSR